MSAKTDQMYSDLVETIRAEVREEFMAALDGGGSTVTRRSAPTSRPAKMRKRPKGAKRGPEEIDDLIKSFMSHVKKHPGQRSEQIAEALGVTTKDLVLPVRKLLTDKAIKTQGQKRGTTYAAR